MPKNLGNLDPLNEEKFFEEFDSLEEDARKERIRDVVQERNDIADTNRKLFARAKEAEGFKQDDDGNWIKIVEKKPEAKSVKSDETLLKRLDTMAFKMAGITADDEVEFVNKWKQDNGYENVDTDTVLSKRGFQTEFADFRTAKANTAATTNIRGEGATSGAKNDPAYWIAKATKGDDGKLRFPEETPKELYGKIIAKLGEGEPGASKGKLEFYNK